MIWIWAPLLEIPFLSKFGPKIQMFVGIWLIWIWSIQLLMFTFSVFKLKISFLGKFDPKKIKIVSSSWNLVLRLIWICRNQCCCLRFLLQTRNTLLNKFCLKYQDYQFKGDIWNLDLSEYAEFNRGAHFFWFRPEIPFLGTLFGYI